MGSWQVLIYSVMAVDVVADFFANSSLQSMHLPCSS